MRKLIIPTLLILLVSCVSKPNKNSESRFGKFVGNLPSKNLPLNFSCGLPDESALDNLQSSEFHDYAEFIPSDQNLIYGIIGKTQEFTLIVYGESGDDIYPTLYSYNKLGERIDSLSLVLSPCGGADGSVIPSSTVHIDKGLRITLSDTIKYIHYLDNSVYVSDSLKTSSVIYSIDKSGRIIKE